MTNDATARVRQVWQDQADTWYEQREAMFAASRPIHEWLVKQLEPHDDQRVLEIGAGPGDTGFVAAPLLGSGRLTSTDLAPGMVEAARKRGDELGITNVDYQVVDAQAMDFADASFDGVICRWGFMLMPDPAAAFRECRRVLVPRGRLVFAVFTGPEENPFASIPARVLTEAGHVQPPTEWRPGILALGDRARLHGLLDDTGFTSTHIDAVNMTWTFPDTDGFWDFLVGITLYGPLLRALPRAARDAVRAAIDEGLTPYVGAGGVALPSRCWCGIAVR